MGERLKPARLGVMLDLLLFDIRESDGDGLVEETLGLNPGLAGRLARAGHALALDEVVMLPEERPAVRTVQQIKLWD